MNIQYYSEHAGWLCLVHAIQDAQNGKHVWQKPNQHGLIKTTAICNQCMALEARASVHYEALKPIGAAAVKK